MFDGILSSLQSAFIVFKACTISFYLTKAVARHLRKSKSVVLLCTGYLCAMVTLGVSEILGGHCVPVVYAYTLFTNFLTL